MTDARTSAASRLAFRGAEILVRADSPLERGAADLDCAAAPLPDPLERVVFPSGPVSESYPQTVQAPDGWEWRPFRSVIGALPERDWIGAARALAYVGWRASTRFCGRCGAPNGDKPDEIARLCPGCGALAFPRISPAVLAVVRRGDRLLLARNASFKAGTWSVLAGFVEPGETLEGCVRREVLEEVSIEVEPRAYLGSQPWPFPDQLMVGLSAEWASGELAPDGVEIAEAGWFGPDDHPPLPMPGSLSRRLIDAAFSDIRSAGTRR
ncbi:MAG: NAD(+) diphosphatase [Spirochaetae bacterium HGW-Spirochaetae-3]|jgi:NAD+ diphosphatase|nr:MAG: NAD(+) diphosphatase [Spirochaetae bacterium HGW-Spirochaetae-3]